jgi:hypothetical protein
MGRRRRFLWTDFLSFSRTSRSFEISSSVVGRSWWSVSDEEVGSDSSGWMEKETAESGVEGDESWRGDSGSVLVSWIEGRKLSGGGGLRGGIVGGSNDEITSYLLSRGCVVSLNCPQHFLRIISHILLIL